MTATPQITSEVITSLRESHADEVTRIQDRIDEIDAESDRLLDAGLDDTAEAVALYTEAMTLIDRLNSLIR